MRIKRASTCAFAKFAICFGESKGKFDLAIILSACCWSSILTVGIKFKKKSSAQTDLIFALHSKHTNFSFLFQSVIFESTINAMEISILLITQL